MNVQYWDEKAQEWKEAPYCTKLVGKIIIFPRKEAT